MSNYRKIDLFKTNKIIVHVYMPIVLNDYFSMQLQFLEISMVNEIKILKGDTVWLSFRAGYT